VGLLHRLRADHGAGNVEELAVELDRVGRPDRLQRLKRFRKALAADVPVAADGLVFLGRPADPETNVQPRLKERRSS
jgi:hypothetical protein